LTNLEKKRQEPRENGYHKYFYRLKFYDHYYKHFFFMCNSKKAADRLFEFFSEIRRNTKIIRMKNEIEEGLTLKELKNKLNYQQNLYMDELKELKFSLKDNIFIYQHEVDSAKQQEEDSEEDYIKIYYEQKNNELSEYLPASIKKKKLFLKK
jgi:hypothetical protein